MKTNANELISLLDGTDLGFFALVEFNWNQNYYYTDLGRDVTWNGNLYLANPMPIVSMEPLKYSSIVDREAFNLQISAIDPAMRAEFDFGIVNRSVKIRTVFTSFGAPQLGLSQTLLLYEGTVSKISEVISNETRIFNIECTAPLSNLDATGTLYTTRDGMKVFNANDTSFDTVFEGSEAISLKWGKV
jgi:hypothetical protein